MLKLELLVFVIPLILVSCNGLKKNEIGEKERYKVDRLESTFEIDGNWNKPVWQEVEPLVIKNFKGDLPGFKPKTQAKMRYDAENLYVIFRVEDQYVRCITTEYNGSVWEDACVEFFFAPNAAASRDYFNLEINCGGTPLMRYNAAGNESKSLPPEMLQSIEIAHSLPEFIDPEMEEPTTWTLEYKLPLELLSEYSDFDEPKPGTEWYANFYKIAENNSNPHYITWSPIGGVIPDFHQPEFFGKLEFN